MKDNKYLVNYKLLNVGKEKDKEEEEQDVMGTGTPPVRN
jgi:hypothetical protein